MSKERSQKRSTGKLIVHIILIVGALLMVGPFIWMILTSFMSLGESTRVPPVIIPAQLRWQNYQRVFTSFPFMRFYWNTFSTTVMKVAGQVFFCSMAAYAFARIRFPGRDFLFVMILSVLMVPSQAYIIPRYLLMARLGWLNTLTALTVPGLTSSFGTFLLRQFFMSLPTELEEAATLDGCNHFQIYYKIFAPLAKSGMIALAIFTALWSWNDLMWPLIVNSSPLKMPLSAGLSSLQGQYGTDFPLLMAGSLMAIAPMIAMFIVLQNQFVEGIALTGTKG
ncbi:MAG: carbohydrate ABC transporter permease [Firmicutes bacterium]|jgi:multiple sugar transport system permease protein|nr:carbohydrate ABC transporter permease [Bacillota bacterium]